METNLQGRLRNTKLPLSRGLLPFFEAVVNSIHAIEEAGIALEKGKINIEIIRGPQEQFDFDSGQKKPGPKPTDEIVGFIINDNGIGFNDVNMKSFLTLDSAHKIEKGGRGVGRLLWLKAFKRAHVHSVYESEDKKLYSIDFNFNENVGVDNEEPKEIQGEAIRGTAVHLDGFKTKYREASHKTLTVIASNLFEHCLWYFVRQGGAPQIIISDNGHTIYLDKIYEESMQSSADTSSIEIKKYKFELTHVKFRASSTKSHIIALCAANRLVKEENIRGKISGLWGNLVDGDGEFAYACYVSSPYLDENVRSERTGFDIDEQVNGLFSKSEISLADINEGVLASVSDYLSKYLDENKKQGRERINDFVSNRAPRYRPILNKIPEDRLIVDPSISDKELDLTLHKELSEIEGSFISEGHDLMRPKVEDTIPNYKERLEEYIRTVKLIKQSDLANYVFHRKVILDFLSIAIQKNENGQYAREELIHKLIIPLRLESNDIVSDGCNLWLLDERLAFHDYLASDKTILSMPITESESIKEPDILALNVFNSPILVSDKNSFPPASIVVVEIKRPMRDDAKAAEDKDPIKQALGYLNLVREGKVTTQSGRLIPNADRIPGYCYIICDLTDSIKEICEYNQAIRSSDGLGYFFYHNNFMAYVEIISFDGLLESAKKRNRAFFDRLELPAT